MAKNLDRILVIDVESTCWEAEPPSGQESEIVEIGICLLDVSSLSLERRPSILVKPESSTVGEFCARLTGLTQEEVEQGISFGEACGVLRRDYTSRDRVWASYGDYDRRQFERQSRLRRISYPFGPTHLNVKNLFAVTLGLREEVGMAEALSLLRLDLVGTHHRAGDDAWNIGRLLATLLAKTRSRLLSLGEPREVHGGFSTR